MFHRSVTLQIHQFLNESILVFNEGILVYPERSQITNPGVKSTQGDRATGEKPGYLRGTRIPGGEILTVEYRTKKLNPLLTPRGRELNLVDLGKQDYSHHYIKLVPLFKYNKCMTALERTEVLPSKSVI